MILHSTVCRKWYKLYMWLNTQMSYALFVFQICILRTQIAPAVDFLNSLNTNTQCADAVFNTVVKEHSVFACFTPSLS